MIHLRLGNSLCRKLFLKFRIILFRSQVRVAGHKNRITASEICRKVDQAERMLSDCQFQAVAFCPRKICMVRCAAEYSVQVVAIHTNFEFPRVCFISRCRSMLRMNPDLVCSCPCYSKFCFCICSGNCRVVSCSAFQILLVVGCLLIVQRPRTKCCKTICQKQMMLGCAFCRVFCPNCRDQRKHHCQQ